MTKENVQEQKDNKKGGIEGGGELEKEGGNKNRKKEAVAN
jgi:hypothetical protein